VITIYRDDDGEHAAPSDTPRYFVLTDRGERTYLPTWYAERLLAVSRANVPAEVRQVHRAPGVE
jgi:hypothetical protein